MLHAWRTSYLFVYISILVINAGCFTANKVVKHSIPELAANNASFQQQFLTAVNSVRVKARKCGTSSFSAAPPLSLESKLNYAAYKHSLDMSENQFLGHTSSNGDTLVERMQNVNYLWSAVGENIAYNQKDIEQVIGDWLSSPGHCRNLMSHEYTQTGVALVNKYWTQVYAAPK